MNKLFLTQREIRETVPAFDEHLLFALERRYFDFLSPDRLELAENISQVNFDSRTDLRMIRMSEVSYEENTNTGLHLLNFQNVLASMKDDSHNLVSVIHGDGLKASLYYGLAKRRDKEACFGTDQYARMLGNTIRGNFLGANYEFLCANDIQSEIVSPMLEYKRITAFPGIPSLRDASGPFVQGIDRFMEAMRGEQYLLVCIAEPVNVPVVDGMVKNLFDLSSEVHASVKATVQKMKGSSDTVNVGLFGMKGLVDSRTEGTADTEGTTLSDTKTEGEQEGSTTLGSGGVLLAASSLIANSASAVCKFIPGTGGLIGAGIGALISIGGAAVTAYSGLPLSTSRGTSSAFSTTRS